MAVVQIVKRILLFTTTGEELDLIDDGSSYYDLSPQHRYLFGYSDMGHVSGYPIHICDLLHQKYIHLREDILFWIEHGITITKCPFLEIHTDTDFEKFR